MRVLLVNDGPVELGHGTEAHVRALFEALREKGHQPCIAAGQVRGEPALIDDHRWYLPGLNAPPLRKRVLSNVRELKGALREVRRLIEEFNPEVIHVHNLLNPFALRALRELRPVVKSIHDCRPFCSKPFPNVATRLVGGSDKFCSRTMGWGCFPRCYMASSFMGLIGAWSYFPHNYLALREVIRCDRVVVYSEYLRGLALGCIQDRHRVELVHLFAGDAAGVNGSPRPERPSILFVGRLSYEKGGGHLLEALGRVRQELEVVVAGDGVMREELERTARAIPGKTFRFLGYVEPAGLKKLYAAASLVVFPSIGSEGCPMVGLEALAASRPVVGFDAGGVREWLVDGLTGYLVARGDVEALARKIEALLSNEKAARRMGRNGEQLVLSKFRKDAHIDRLLGIYQDAIACRHARVA